MAPPVSESEQSPSSLQDMDLLTKMIPRLIDRIGNLMATAVALMQTEEDSLQSKKSFHHAQQASHKARQTLKEYDKPRPRSIQGFKQSEHNRKQAAQVHMKAKQIIMEGTEGLKQDVQALLAAERGLVATIQALSEKHPPLSRSD